MASSRAFFCAVESSATRAAAARARSSRSRVESPELSAVAISAPDSLRRKIGSDPTLDGSLNGVRMTPIHDRHMDPRRTRRLGRPQLGAHPPGPQLALAVAEVFHRGRKRAHDAQKLWSLATIRHVETIHVGQK